MNLHLTIDRFEGEKKQTAVLLSDDGEQINFPKGLLPKGVKAGDILSFTIEKDDEATKLIAQQTHDLQEELKETDPGGDIKLRDASPSPPLASSSPRRPLLPNSARPWTRRRSPLSMLLTWARGTRS